MSATIVLAQGGGCMPLDVMCSVTDAAVGWFVELTRSITKGAVTMMGFAMTFWTLEDRSSMLKTPAIGEIHGMLAYVGIALLVGSLIWQGIMLMYKRKSEPLVNAGMGLLAYVGWSSLGTVIAGVLYEGGVGLSAHLLGGSIEKFSNTMANSMLGTVAGNPGTMFFLSIVLLFLAGIQWVLGYFRMGALVILLALIPTAAAGQLNEATKPWLRRILTWMLCLILYQPISACVYAIGFELIGEGQDLGVVLTGLAVLTMAVLAMPTMLRFFDWGGQKFATGGSGGGAAGIGAAAAILGPGVSSVLRMMERNGPASTPPEHSGAQKPPVQAANTGEGPGSQSRTVPALPGPTDPGRGGNSGKDLVPVSSATGPNTSSATPTGAGTATAGGGTATAGGGTSAAANATPAGAIAGAALESGNRARQGLNEVGGALTDGKPDG